MRAKGKKDSELKKQQPQASVLRLLQDDYSSRVFEPRKNSVLPGTCATLQMEREHGSPSRSSF